MYEGNTDKDNTSVLVQMNPIAAVPVAWCVFGV